MSDDTHIFPCPECGTNNKLGAKTCKNCRADFSKPAASQGKQELIPGNCHYVHPASGKQCPLPAISGYKKKGEYVWYCQLHDKAKDAIEAEKMFSLAVKDYDVIVKNQVQYYETLVASRYTMPRKPGMLKDYINKNLPGMLEKKKEVIENGGDFGDLTDFV